MSAWFVAVHIGQDVKFLGKPRPAQDLYECSTTRPCVSLNFP